jgi:Protein of unknown function (DUF4031)
MREAATDTLGVKAMADRRMGELPARRGVYVDAAIWQWQGLKWAHLLAEDTDELHRFAMRLGIHRASYQGPPRTTVPHYDVTATAGHGARRHCLQPRRDRRDRASDALA